MCTVLPLPLNGVMSKQSTKHYYVNRLDIFYSNLTQKNMCDYQKHHLKYIYFICLLYLNEAVLKKFVQSSITSKHLSFDCKQFLQCQTRHLNKSPSFLILGFFSSYTLTLNLYQTQHLIKFYAPGTTLIRFFSIFLIILLNLFFFF